MNAPYKFTGSCPRTRQGGFGRGFLVDGTKAAVMRCNARQRAKISAVKS
jgi:hypothetical protein